MFTGYKGAAKRLDDRDLPKLAATIGVGEDEIHAVMDVESRGSGFDQQGRLAMLFEPHIFYRELGTGKKRTLAAQQGLAYKDWKKGAYPKDSYPRLIKAMAIDETAALRSCSWGLAQVMGFNHQLCGYPTVQAMVEAFAADEEHQLAAMVTFIKVRKIDDDLRRHDWKGFATVYNGDGQADYYAKKLADAYRRWRQIKDTPWNPDKMPPMPDMPDLDAPGPNPAPPTPDLPDPLPSDEKAAQGLGKGLAAAAVALAMAIAAVASDFYGWLSSFIPN